jgi:hypothetical protein
LLQPLVRQAPLLLQPAGAQPPEEQLPHPIIKSLYIESPRGVY